MGETTTGGDFESFDVWGDKGEVLPDEGARKMDLGEILQGTLKVRRPKKIERRGKNLSDTIDSALRLKKKSKASDATTKKPKKIKEEDSDGSVASQDMLKPPQKNHDVTDIAETTFSQAKEDLPESTQIHTVSSKGFLKKKNKVSWTEEETSRFYRALSMFNLNFSLLQNMFPGKNEKDCKKKYTVEQRKYPKKVTKALETRKQIDLLKYNSYKQESDELRDVIKRDPFGMYNNIYIFFFLRLPLG